MAQTNDLGKDSIGRLMFRLSLPAITAQIINMLYNIVDRMYIGHIPEIGPKALTGVGVTFPIIMLISAFSVLVGMGGAPRAAIKMGESDHEGAEKILGHCFVTLLGLSVVLTAVFLIFQKDLLMLFGASSQTLPYALDYLTIYVCGTVFVQMALGLNSFINTQGFAKTGMLTVVIGAVLNIVLDPIFIFVFQMGVKGAALATILSQAISAVWVLEFLFGKKTKLKIRKENFRIEWAVLGPVLALGLSPFIMQSTECLLNIALNSSLQRYGGDVAVGAMTILSSIVQFCMMPLQGLAQGAQPIISFNYGAKQFGRVKSAFKLLFISSVTFAGLLWGALMLFPQGFVRIFSSDPELTKMTVWAIRVFMAMLFMMGIQNACQQTFVSIGQAKISLFLALLRKIILLIPLIYILPSFFSNQVFAVFLAEPIADTMAATTTAIVFATYFRKLLKRHSLEAPGHAS